MVYSLVYWGLTPQQQPGSYQGGEMMKSVFWWRKPGYQEVYRERIVFTLFRVNYVSKVHIIGLYSSQRGGGGGWEGGRGRRQGE